jgi:ABC-type Zn uptake system ZnuABC Zn-binding protein ZnuA
MRAAVVMFTVVFLGLPADASARLRVAASFYPLAHFAEQVGGGHVAVENIMPPGAEPHEYEPSPRDSYTTAGGSTPGPRRWGNRWARRAFSPFG